MRFFYFLTLFLLSLFLSINVFAVDLSGCLNQHHNGSRAACPGTETNAVWIRIFRDYNPDTNTKCRYYSCHIANNGGLSAFDDLCRIQADGFSQCSIRGDSNYNTGAACPMGYDGPQCDEWVGCGSGYKSFQSQFCLDDDKCYKTILVVGINSKSYLQPIEIPCDAQEGDTATNSETSGCSIFSIDYQGQRGGVPVCTSSYPDVMPPNIPDDCTQVKGGYIDGVWTSVCVESGASDTSGDEVKSCPSGYISIDGDCEKVGVADRDESTDVQFNPDGSRTETKQITETIYNPDGSKTVNSWTETQEYDEDNQEVGDRVISDKEVKEERASENQASASGNCSFPPTCSGDAIQCAILTQNWRSTCEMQRLADREMAELGLTGSELSDILSDVVGDGDSVTVSPSDFSDVGDVSAKPSLTASDYDAAFSVEGGNIASIEALPDSTQIDVLQHVQEMELDIVISTACIPDIEITVLSAQIIIPLSEHCDFFKKVSYLVQFFFIYLVFRQFTNLIQQGF